MCVCVHLLVLAVKLVHNIGQRERQSSGVEQWAAALLRADVANLKRTDNYIENETK